LRGHLVITRTQVPIGFVSPHLPGFGLHHSPSSHVTRAAVPHVSPSFAPTASGAATTLATEKATAKQAVIKESARNENLFRKSGRTATSLRDPLAW